jgi:membrane protease YdiL (CAAX protease family)
MGLTLAEVGLGRKTVRSSLLLGLSLGLCAPLIALGFTKWSLITGLPWWDNAIVSDSSLLYRLAFRIPVGTAAFEELAFRGVLFGALMHEGENKALWLTSGIFGLYHISLIVRVIDAAGLGPLPPLELAGLILAGVAITFIWGLAFGFVRWRSGNVVGAIVTHWLAYASANVLLLVLTGAEFRL